MTEQTISEIYEICMRHNEITAQINAWHDARSIISITLSTPDCEQKRQVYDAKFLDMKAVKETALDMLYEHLNACNEELKKYMK